jgi:hypothetical protein
MPAIKCVKIHLLPTARDRAARALFPNGGKDYRDFTGPDFQDVAEAMPYPECIRVVLKDGSEYLYPLHQVARVKIYKREVVA